MSAVFPLPAWQADVGVPSGAGGTDAGGAANGPGGRGVPDVSAVADPQTGYRIRVDGKDIVIGGTSAVAPLWAALVARLVQSTGKPLGLAQPLLYDSVGAGQVAAGFRDITTGDNGAYRGGRGLGRLHRSRRARRHGAARPRSEPECSPEWTGEHLPSADVRRPAARGSPGVVVCGARGAGGAGASTGWCRRSRC